MKRRTYLAGVGAGIASLTGGFAAAEATRVDVAADPSLVRGDGDPVATRETIERDSVEYLEATDEVRYATLRRGDEPAAYETEPFERWAKRTCASAGSRAVLPAIDDRFENPIEGVGKGVRGLLLGPVISVDYTVTRGRDGKVASEPNVGFDELVAATPRTVDATIAVGGREHTRAVPVAVKRVEVRYLGGDWSPNGSRASE